MTAQLGLSDNVLTFSDNNSTFRISCSHLRTTAVRKNDRFVELASGCRRVDKPFLADVFSRSNAAIAKRIRPTDYSEYAISFALQPCVVG
jgi:hypothetical protein